MKKAYFISDTHLGAAYFPDSAERERRVVKFLDSIKNDVSELYLLGDMLDYWFEYRYVVPRGFVRFFGKLAELADAGVKITWIKGNHDIWIYDYIPDELGIEVVDGTLVKDILGTRMLMAHGDGIWADSTKFRLLRKIFRNRMCQKLFSGIHPRWTVAFANAWSRHSRHTSADPACSPRAKSKLDKAISHLEDFATEYHKTHPECKYFLFGHLHKVIEKRIGNDAQFLILGDWIENFSYAVFDGKALRMKRFAPE